MLSEERVKTLLGDNEISNEEVRQIRDGFYNLAEIIFNKWQGKKINKDKNGK